VAQRHPDPPAPSTPARTPDDALTVYLRAQSTEFLRALRLHGEAPAESTRALRRAARRLTATLHTYRPLLNPAWSDQLHPELAWLSGTLGAEHTYEGRLTRLLGALARLSDPAYATVSGPRADPTPRTGSGAPAAATVHLGAAKAAALLERQLTLARTRAHSTALQALGSARFHAVADKVAVLASDVPLTTTPDGTDLRSLAAAAEERLTDAVAALPVLPPGHPCTTEPPPQGLADTPWHQVRLLLRLHRYAQEVLDGDGDGSPHPRLLTAVLALNRHRDAAEAAGAAAQAARTPRIAPATAYTLGVLHADQRHEVEACRFAFQQAWRQRPVAPARH